MEEENKSLGKSGGTQTGYYVEARCSCDEPRQYGDHIYSTKWKRVHFTKGPTGVPQSGFRENVLSEFSLYGYQTAQALRWWFHAEAEKSALGSLCLETRIVKCKVEFSFSCDVLSSHDVIGAEDRTSIMPDYGKEQP